MRSITLDPEVVEALRYRGGQWGVYENQAFDSSQVGHVKLLRFGEGCTYQEPPQRLPDTASEINWPYVLVTTVDAQDLQDNGSVEVPQ